jgi:predicted RND superfamily exporter protein
LAVAFAVTPGVLRLRVESSAESVLDQTGEEWATYQESIRTFGNDEDLVVAVSSADAYDHATIGTVLELTRALSRLSGIERVDSISTTPIVGEDHTGVLSLQPLVDPDTPASSATLREAVAGLARTDSVRGLLVSEDGRTFGVRLRLAATVDGYAALIRDVRDLAQASGAWVSGVPIFRDEATTRTRAELLLLVPGTIIVIGMALLFAFRSAWALVLAMAVGALGTWFVLGIMGVLAVPLTLSTSILPSILLAIGTAGSVHLLSETSGATVPAVLSREAIRVSDPILISGVTTSLAFLSGAMVPIDAIRYVAAFGAIGALILSVATVSFGSALLALGGPASSRPYIVEKLADHVGSSVFRIVVAKPLRVLFTWIMIVAIAGIGATQVSLETDVTSWFPRGGETRDSYEEIRERLVGISPINVVITAAEHRSVTEPELVRRVAELADFLEELPDVGKVTSVASVLRDVHRVAGPPGAIDELPAEQQLVEQYLLLLEGGEEVRELISDDHAMTNVVLRVNNNGSEHLLSVAEEAEAWWETNGLPGFRATATGIMFEFARAEREIAYGQLAGLLVDMLALLILYLVLFRSSRLALIALAPSLATIGVSFGVLGLVGLPLDAGTVFVGSLALGVTVDETIHLVAALRRGLSMGIGWGKAIETSFAQVFPALVITTSVLALGFMVLALSPFSFVQRLGLLTTVAMVACVVANVTLLPALLLVARRA